MKDPYKLDEYWHVVVTKNSINVESRSTIKCNNNSIACFTKIEFAIEHANTKELK